MSTELDPAVRAALRAGDPGAPPADLADRAFRRAMAEGASPGWLEGFVGAARRLALATAVAAAAAWVVVVARGGVAEAAPAAEVAASDPLAVEVAAWSGEGAP
jgi:hypothetical protein